INFGKGNQRHPSWPQPQYRERDEFFADKTETVSEKETEEKEEETIPKEPEAEKTDYLGWLTDFSRFYSDMQTSSELLKSTRNRLEELRAERAAELEAEKREQRIAEQQKNEVLTENVPDGQYIQIRSIANRREAISYRLSVIGDLEGLLQNPSEQVLITPFGQTFRILIGPFQNYSQARNAQTVIPGKYEGSFIITYPRQSDVSAAAVTPVSEPEPEPEPQPEPEPEQPVRPVMEESPAAVITENVPNGQYIQIRSIGNRREAVDYRSAVVLKLSGVIDNPEERVVITPFRQTFRILIGPFQSVTEARNVQRRTSNLYQGAFVITYPRQGG
ncbi:MAG TPA: SPOR domain-containing protein, partial [Balneolaceae bacterium]|nr:SPOR domain-containing protein [Balneolaceae bacterium]